MLFALLALVIIAPFERALVTWPDVITITSVELAALVFLAVYGVVLVRDGRSALPVMPVSVVVTASAFLVSLAVAAAVTSFEPANAVRFVARMVAAATLCLATAQTIDTAARARLLVRVIFAVSVFVAAIAVLEAMQVPVVTAALTLFRPGFHVVAGQLRATSTLAYPTIASMYLEVGFALGLFLLLAPSRGRPAIERSIAFAGLVVVGAGISATFTRAGLLAMAAALLVIAALRLTAPTRQRRDLRLLSSLASLLIAVVFLAHSPELLATRLTTEGTGAWYGATYEVPRTLRMTTGQLQRVPVTLANTGRLTWDSQREPAFALSYHWLRQGTGEVVEFEGQRTTFPTAIAPNQRVDLKADVIAPGQAGRYTLAWDLVHETRAWLSTEGVPIAHTIVDVTGQPRSPVTATMSHLPPATMHPARPALWWAAWEMAREHPWLGIGPDNYRLAYGPYLGAARWDTRIHSNNMYLEILVGSGVVGLVAWLALLAAIALALWRRAAGPSADAGVAAMVAIVVVIVIAGHGIVDSFLGFTTTYVTFAVACGWALARGFVDGGRDAHRV
jgi:hypothetical protein